MYANGAENFVNYITNLNSKSFVNIDIAKSLGNAYKVFSQLIDEPSKEFSTQDIEKIPLGFSYDKKSFQVTNIFQTQKAFESALSVNNDLQIYQNPKQLALSFPSWHENAPGDYTKKSNDIFAPSSHINIGASFYKNDNGTISKGGVLMAFFAGMSGQNPLIDGETTIAGKLLGYDKNMSQSQVEDLNEFIKQNPIEWSITGDVFADSVYITKLRNTITDIDEFKKQWLEMKAKSDEMGEIYKAEIAKQNREIALAQKNQTKKKINLLNPYRAKVKTKKLTKMIIKEMSF
ncbi:Cj0814 family flagellar-dependent secreted protein [Helicobacter burdigaliensis]|uniref:Cj0814 family flagellar-dependent secreted protein n=1 Tax=Helicobacter burdigaliensis TaxID=2315334 RepID=UPI0039E9AD3D